MVSQFDHIESVEGRSKADADFRLGGANDDELLNSI